MFFQPGTNPTSMVKNIHLFIILFRGSVWARKIKSTNIKAEVINLSFLLSRGNLFLSSFVMKANKLACFRPPPVTQDWILMTLILELCTLRSLLSAPSLPLPFALFALNLNKRRTSWSYCTAALRQVKRPLCFCQQLFSEVVLVSQAQSRSTK